ncbi:iron complex transport system permease protein [Selenomonas ruminantium]|uniref:Iron complex transport system permease protein n=1 Tax=Selenomonas ruminantium TaxID=971 RepID=A0A1M6W4G3_SELRU|nr:iron ABC transporter permease [Selenomonas ruminantium]SHK88650.1 iron complex transport system permease protein [Selenomonas ruminantium]
MKNHFVSVLAVMFMLLLFMMLLSLSWGQMDIPFSHVLDVLRKAAGMAPVNGLTPNEEAVIWHIRLPRTLVGLLTGAALAAAGAALQGLFANPLADPAIIGVSSGASVGAIVAIATGLSAATLFALPICALLGALLAVSLTIALAFRRGRIPVLTLLLAGVVVGMFLAAVSAMLLTAVSENKLQEYLFWTIGGLDYRRWEHVWLGLFPIAVSVGIICLLARQLNILSLGETEARAVGLPVIRFRLILLFLAALATATGVCISGNIGFVGLVVPHMLRMLIGPDHRRLLPACVLAGGIFLLFCDIVGRVILSGTEIRVGIMTAFIGTPYFLYLLRKQQRME